MKYAGRKRLVLWLGAASAIALALTAVFPGESTDSEPARSSSDAAAPQAKPQRFASLPSREAIGPSRGELSGPRSWTPDASPAAARHRQKAEPAVPARPVAPSLPYRVAGQVVGEDGMRVVLLKGDRVVEAREGQMLEDGFRLDAVKPRSLTFTYVPLGISQEVAVEGTALDLPPLRTAIVRAPGALPKAAPAAQPIVTPAVNVDASPSAAPAKLEFEGPAQVRAGKPFDVALKVTSPQPVRALPLQLSFDAKRLEALAVRPGELFADGKFTYRTSANGSIFVGASGAGRAAANTDFVIVTFRPIASGPAELKVSSLVMQGAAGRAIAHEPPEVFRASIVE
jgi:hypothetical protein